MARPKKENKKDIQYRVRLDAETAMELEHLHKQSGMCKAWIIRGLIHRAYWGQLPPITDERIKAAFNRSIGKDRK